MRYNRNIRYTNRKVGNRQRETYQQAATHKQALTPKPVVYEDIDKAMFDFVEQIVITDKTKEFPTFTLFSNQIFTEFSQTWEYTDENNNLIVNFKTINRETNPKKGSLVGEASNIPGNRWYTMSVRNTLEDNGDESYELISVKQPFSVDLMYNMTIVTVNMEYLNEFNVKVMDLFKAKQVYIRPNGHFMPVYLESVDESSEKEINQRKFYRHSYKLKVKSYIIKPEDIKIQTAPKRAFETLVEKDYKERKPKIDIEEYECKDGEVTEMNIFIPVCKSKIEFTMDEDDDVFEVETSNVRSYQIFIDGFEVDANKPFKIKRGQNVKIKIIRLKSYEDSKVKLKF